MIIITDKLTVGQITTILRVALQVISYGGIFLIGLIILGNAPRVAPLETHDVLNRVVGKSTTMTTTLKWIARRIIRKNRDPVSSSPLVFALTLSIMYGLFVSLSDLGFLGLETCSVAGSSFTDFPASIKTYNDALASVSSNMLNETLPKAINSYRCDAAQLVTLNANVTERICSSWHNSTFGDSNDVHSLNSTDSDVLMAKYLGKDNYTKSSQLDLNVYFVGANGQPMFQSVIQEGLAIIPHTTGVKMIVGVPSLSKQQRVEIPKTLALETDMGCMPLGTVGFIDTTVAFNQGTDFFLPDSAYEQVKITKYSGPDILQAPLSKAADAVRKLMLPLYNTSFIESNGYYPSLNESSGLYSWQTEVSTYYPPSTTNNSFSAQDAARFILGNCTLELNQMLNVSFPSTLIAEAPSACVIYQFRGSFFSDSSPMQGHGEFVCATSTQVNMVTATLETDSNGVLTENITRLPSTLNIIQADYFDVLHDTPSPGDTTWGNWDPVYRYTLSDNATGPTNHYIYQEFSIAGAAATSFSHGSGSIGFAFPQVGSVMVSVGTSNPTLQLINSSYFSVNNFSSAQVTRWGGAVGASYLLNTVGYNGWAALGSQSLSVVSTGGHLATCYDPRYAAGFLPLVLAFLVVVIWTVVMLVRSRIRETKRLEGMYGGLAPVIVTPFYTKPSADTVLVWENGAEPHLKPAVNGLPIVGGNTETLAMHVQNEIYPGCGSDKY